MTVEDSEALHAASAYIQSTLHESRGKATVAVLPALYLGGAALLCLMGRFSDPYLAAFICLFLCALTVVVWILHYRSHLASAWLLVAGIAVATLLVVKWAGLDVAVFLLTLPAGLATLSVGALGGVGYALVCTALLALVPGSLLPAGLALRCATIMGVWYTVGLILLAQWPMLTALEWSWASYERSRSLLKQARDYRVQLKETLDDLAHANLQLTRLNQLTQGLRQAADDARRAKEQFVANVSHELRTPLNMIIGFSEMIVRAPQVYGKRIPQSLLSDLAVILRNSQHLSSLIDDVLDLSQVEAGKMALTKERVALSEIVDAAAVAVRPLFESKGLYLEVDLAEDLPLILCDRTRIREVLLNLLSNAGRFTSQGGVRVQARREGRDLIVSVADTGPGISNEDASRIFTPFQQLDAGIRREYGGTGLGLVISRSFVELHGGRMWVDSQVGVGSTFSFRLPTDPPRSEKEEVSRWFSPFAHYEERTRQSLAPVANVKPRYVVLESGSSLQRLLTRYEDGIEVVPVTGPEGAMEELARTPAQALVVNVASSGSAMAWLNQPGALPNGTPAIVCSVPGMPEAASALGVEDYLVKPISRDMLLGALGRLELGGRTLLVVDDEPDAVRLFQRMLTSATSGYRVLRAGNGREALNILRSQRVDAILLDLVMPGMDGFGLLEVRAQDPALRKIPVLVLSAQDPAGQPIVTSALTVTKSGGLSTVQLLACIEAITRILSAGGPVRDEVKQGTRPE